jgi:lipopolysaccharide/colanic/teichoic acid biosynthesis glycosyltransferase
MLETSPVSEAGREFLWGCVEGGERILAALALVAFAPLLLGIAAATFALSGRAPFIAHRRVGRQGRELWVWKFRTMWTRRDGYVPGLVEYIADDQGPELKSPDDRRITSAFARFCRRHSIDELPQLVNVICDEMSLVGPRPHAVAHDELFETRIAKYRRRLNVRPGITGWAQVNGLRGPTETDNLMRARVEHDLYYIDHWSVWLDLYILFATLVSYKAYRNAL